MIARRLGCLIPLLVATRAFAASPDLGALDTGTIPSPHVYMPAENLRAEVVLISDRDGWTTRDHQDARTLQDQGVLVVGIDLPHWLDTLDHDGGACIFTMTSIEELSHQLQRLAGRGDYRLPIIAGAGAGGAMALAIAAQTPDATIGQSLAVDPDAGVAFGKDLCTQAPRHRVGARLVTGFEATLPNPVRIILTSVAARESRDHAEALRQQQPTVVVADAKEDAAGTLLRELVALTATDGPKEGPLDLPLTVLDARPSRDTLAVIYSGDGGWRDIDKKIAAELQASGIPVVGVDSLRYFWKARTPDETAADLSRVLKLYKRQWQVRNVLLIGYSFGANILPPTFNKLPAGDRTALAQMSLLAFATRTEFQVSISGWLGTIEADPDHDPVSDVAPLDAPRVQCIYGTEETNSACPGLRPLGAEVIPIQGGHHFDGDYQALARRIVMALDRRLGRDPSGLVVPFMDGQSR